jgi:hypothetical protein
MSFTLPQLGGIEATGGAEFPIVHIRHNRGTQQCSNSEEVS